MTTTGSGTNAIYGGTAATWTITNAGAVSSSAGDGIVLEDGGSVTNNSTGTIKGDQYGIVFNAGPGSVTNSGSISSALGVDSVIVDFGDGGSLTNLAGGTITGGNVFINGAVGTVTNSGIIATDSEDGVELAAGGSVTNNAGGSISNTDAAGVGVFIEVASGMVTNAGSISAVGGNGVLLLEGGSVSNAASGSITGQGAGIFVKNQAGTVTNAGNISATTGTESAGIYLQNNGMITNTSTGTITGGNYGAFIEGGGGTVTNFGSISGGDAVLLGLGGTVTNAVGASISGGSNGVYIKYRAAGTVTNSGNISASGTGGAGVDLALGGSLTNNSSGSITGNAFGVFVKGAGGTVANAGAISGATYAVDFAGSGTNRLIVDPGAQFIGKVTANSTAANTIELVSGTGSIGGLGGVGSAFTNFQTLAVDAGGSWTLAGANTTSSVLDAGSLDLAGTLNNSATIAFQGSSSQLLIDNAASFGSNIGTPSYTGPQLQHFVGGDKIDLKNISSANVNLNYNATTGLLQITNGASQVATLDFQNSSLGSGTFQAMSDGGLGTLITLSGSSPPPPPPPPIAGADVQWQNGLGGELAVWGMNGAQAVSSNIVSLGGSPAVPDATWSVAGLGDFNGDGTNDFLWRNAERHARRLDDERIPNHRLTSGHFRGQPGRAGQLLECRRDRRFQWGRQIRHFVAQRQRLAHRLDDERLAGDSLSADHLGR